MNVYVFDCFNFKKLINAIVLILIISYILDSAQKQLKAYVEVVRVSPSFNQGLLSTYKKLLVYKANKRKKYDSNVNKTSYQYGVVVFIV